jgi:hypothetical protein
MRVVREEGVLALWRGCSPTVTRAMIVTASQMAVYDKSKARLALFTHGTFGTPLFTHGTFHHSRYCCASKHVQLLQERQGVMQGDDEEPGLRT